MKMYCCSQAVLNLKFCCPKLGAKKFVEFVDGRSWRICRVTFMFVLFFSIETARNWSEISEKSGRFYSF